MPKTAPLELGWPQHKRDALLKSLAGKPTGRTQPIEFQGKVRDMPVASIPIGLAKYRLLNGRTVSAQQEYLAKNSKLSANFFRQDQELADAQKAQHEILKQMIPGAGLENHFADAKQKQVEPIILDSEGFVVNGNRRLCCWRELYSSDTKKYSHFENVEAVILPPCSEEDIDRLEARLQLQRDIKDDYEWHSRANMYKQRMKDLKTNESGIADLYKIEKKEIVDLLEMLGEAEQYLKLIGRQGEWSLLDKFDYVFRPLVEKRRTMQGAGEKEFFRAAVFAAVSSEAAKGRRYAAVKDIHKHLPAIKRSLGDEFGISTKSTGAKTSAGVLGKAKSSAGATDLLIAEAMLKDAKAVAKAGSAVVDALEGEKALADENKKKSETTQMLRKAHALLQAALGATKHSKDRVGTAAQLHEIEHILPKLAAWSKGK